MYKYKESIWQSPEEHLQNRQEEEEAQEEGELRHLHLQGVEAGAPRHRYLQQGHVDHELVRERHFRAHRRRSFPSRPLQQEVHHHVEGGPNFRQAPAAR